MEVFQNRIEWKLERPLFSRRWSMAVDGYETFTDYI